MLINLYVLPVSGFVTGSIKDKSAKVFRASKAEPSSTKREVKGREWRMITSIKIAL